MTKILTQTADDTLASLHADAYQNVIIAGVSRKKYIKQADYSYGRDFAAATATIVVDNPDGMFSPGVETEIRKGDPVIIEEGIIHRDGQIEIYSGFTGFVKQRKFGKKGMTVGLQCIDNINILAGADIDYTRVGDRTEVTKEELEPHFIHLYSGSGNYTGNYVEDLTQSWGQNDLENLWLFDDQNRAYPIKYNSDTRATVTGISSGVGLSKSYSIGEGIAQVFDALHDNWARWPLPSITVRNNSDLARELNAFMVRDEVPTEWSGFNIDYENGQVVLNLPVDGVHYRIEASYSHYDRGVYVEDILEDIIVEADGYGATPLTVTKNLATSFGAESRETYDAMIPNYSPDTDPDVVTSLAQDVDSSTAELWLRKGSYFTAPIVGVSDYLQIGSEVVKFEGRDLNIVSGLTRGQLGTVETNHSRGDKVYQVYPAGQLWFTRWNNITTELVAADFETGDDVRDINLRYGRITLGTPIALDSDVRCTNDYRFKTLQATGVQVNEIELRERDYKLRIDAIKKVKTLVAPNYVLRTEGDARIWGSYLNQKYDEDYILRLAENLDYEDEEDTYTHVKLYGQNNNPTNLMTKHPPQIIQSKYWAGSDGAGYPGQFVASGLSFTDDEIKGYQLMDGIGNFHQIYGNHDINRLIISGLSHDGDYKIGRFHIGEAWDHALDFVGENDADYYKFTPGLGSMGRIITNYPESPVIKINGIPLDGPQPVAVGPVPVKKITDLTTITTTVAAVQGQQTPPQVQMLYNYAIQLPHTDIISNIYKLSDGLVDVDNDIFIYLVGQGGGGIHASIQFFSSADNVVPYVAGNWADVSQLDPLFTIPVNHPDIDYRAGLWLVRGIPSYEKIEKALYESIDTTATTIKILVQKYYQDLSGHVSVIPLTATGTGGATLDQGYPLWWYKMTDTSKSWSGSQLNGQILIDSTGREATILETHANYVVVSSRVSSGTYHIYPESATSPAALQDPLIRIYSHLYEGNTWVDAELALRAAFTDFSGTQYGRSIETALSWIFKYVLAYAQTNMEWAAQYHFYEAATGRQVYNAMRFGGRMIDDPADTDNPVLTIDNKELITYTGLNKVDEREEFFDLTDTMNGRDLYTGFARLPPGGGTFWVRGPINMRVVNQVWELTGCERGVLGSSPLHHITSYSPQKRFATMDGPNIVQKRFYYRNFAPGAPISDMDNIGSAIYYVWHEDDGDPDFYIDYSDTTFMIKKSFFADIVYDVPNDIVQADFKYAQRLVPLTNWQQMFDGRYDTKAQSYYTVAPLPGTEIFTIDFGYEVEIDAIDILGGYFSLPGINTGIGQIQFTNNYTLRYSLDNLTYLLPTDKAENFSLASGNTFSLERDDLGVGFRARYLKLELESAQKHDYDGGKWFIAIADFRAWADTVLVGDAKLISRAETGTGTGASNQMTDGTKSWTINQWVSYWLVDRYGNEFYITANTANGLTVSGVPNSGEYWIFRSRQTPSTVYDRDDLLTQLGDRLYKKTDINEQINRQSTIDRMAKDNLREYIKNHQRCSATVAFHPAIRMGQTVRVIDNQNNIDRRFFVEGVAKQGWKKTLTMGHYPD